MKRDFHSEFENAKKIIEDAAEVVRSYIGKSPSVIRTKGDIYNIVTEADERVENLLRDELSQIYPDYGFIGEEGEEIIKDTAWIIDPIDGTVAFEKNIPEFGIAVALKHQNEVIFSLLYRISTNDLFSAYQDEGTFKNGERVYASKVADLQNAVISISQHNFWYEKYHDYTHKLITKVRFFRVGCCSLNESLLIAEGKIDVLIKLDQFIWDVAPEYLIMKEAGVKITDEKGHPLELRFNKQDKHSYIAATEELHENTKGQLYLV